MSAKAHRAAQQDDRVSVASAKISDEPTSKSSKFRIRKNEPIPEGIKRIVAGQIDKGIERLGSAELDDDEAIHDARVCSKKIRAVLRLVRGELERKAYKRENACFRDAARRLSHVRDTAALVEILDKVRAKCPDECEPATVDYIRSLLIGTERKEKALKRGAMTEASTVFSQARERVADWPIREDAFRTLKPGLKKTYARGRSAFHKAFEEPSGENFHQRRKEAKRLLYQSKILRSGWPKMLKAFSLEIGELADHLSVDHDLAALRRAISAMPPTSELPAVGIESLLSLIARARLEARAGARLLGDRIYAEKPAVFTRRMGGYWDSSRRKGMS